MTQIEASYFDWLCSKCDVHDHKKLLCQLLDTEFTYSIELDGNRAEDGVDLRYRFGKEHGIAQHRIATALDQRPCSVLEMMVALALRIEEEIMSDCEKGDRTGVWFKTMLQNLRLVTMDDRRYDERIVYERIRTFLDRQFAINGDGSLFRLRNPRRNMRNVEIWYAAMWYLDEIQGGSKYA